MPTSALPLKYFRESNERLDGKPHSVVFSFLKPTVTEGCSDSSNDKSGYFIF